VADLADAELLLSLTLFLTADKCAAVYSTAAQTTGTLCAIKLDTTDYCSLIELKKL
jgi:hypothetical protein